MSAFLNGVQSAVGGANSAAGNASSLLNTVSSLVDGSWLSELLPASWRGITFLIRSEEHSTGRRTAPHRYAFRDDVWAEDLGRAERTHEFSAFLIGDSCYSQAKALIAASEQKGSGKLVHPWLGTKTVSLLDPIRTSTRMEIGRVVEVRFRFIETNGGPIYPTSATNTQSASATTSIASFISQAVSFANKIGTYASLGATVFSAAVSTVEKFTSNAENLVYDASVIGKAVIGLTPPLGLYFGRYASGSRSVALANAVTPDDAIGIVSAQQAIVVAAIAAVQVAAGNAALAANPLPFAAQVLTEALRAACADPADATRILSALAVLPAQVSVSTAPIGAAITVVNAATAAICRQAALYSLALACADYVPTSSNDAYALRDLVIALFDAEAVQAADAGYGAEYLALKAQRTAICADLDARAAHLPALIDIETAAPMPSLTLAYKFYGDASRADELTARSEAQASMFLPTSFEGLSS